MQPDTIATPAAAGLPLPLHGLSRLKADGRVMLVSDRDLATRLAFALPDVSVLAGRAGVFDLSPLAGRKVVADSLDLARAVLAAGAANAGTFDGVAAVAALDAGRKGVDLEAAIRPTVRPVQLDPAPVPPPVPAPEPPSADMGTRASSLPAPSSPLPADDGHHHYDDERYGGGGYGGPPDDSAPFRALGYDRRRFYFVRRVGGQVLDYSARDLKEIACLLEMAPAHYWQLTYPSKSGFDGVSAANDLIRQCQSAGIYDPDRVRGRGCWWDDGRAVLHMGDQLIIDGEEAPLGAYRGHYHYEEAQRLPIACGDPLAPADAKKLYDICSLINFDTPDLAPLFAGFMVVAPVCGALRWRSHAWLTGEAGTGKTWVLDNICRPVIGTIALRVQSKSTEAGVRQRLGSDGRPVVFDEAETQNDRDRERVQLILDLARQASSEDGAPIAKGTVSGRAQMFHIRSSFLFSSINLPLSQQADESRTIVFSLRNRANLSEEGALDAAERFARLERLVAETVTPEWCGALLARTLALLPAIRANTEVFARAWAERFGSRRQGDTLGSALAGFYSLFSTKILTLDEARRFLTERGWVAKAAAQTETVPDQVRALEHLLEQTVRVQPGSGPAFDRPIISLIACVATAPLDLHGEPDDTHDVDGVHPKTAIQHLGFVGIRVDREAGMVWLARKHSRTSALFAGTPWVGSWETMAERIDGAVRVSPKAIRFGQLVKRAVGVPIEAALKT